MELRIEHWILLQTVRHCAQLGECITLRLNKILNPDDYREAIGIINPCGRYAKLLGRCEQQLDSNI